LIKPLYYSEEYDILALQKVAINKFTGKAYYLIFSRYAVIYNGGKAVLYLYKRWNIKKLQLASEND
jgi:hypothetical protein